MKGNQGLDALAALCSSNQQQHEVAASNETAASAGSGHAPNTAAPSGQPLDNNTAIAAVLNQLTSNPSLNQALAAAAQRMDHSALAVLLASHHQQQQQQQQQAPPNTDLLTAVQQFALQQYMQSINNVQAQQQQQQQQQAQQNHQAALLMAAQQLQQQQQQQQQREQHAQQQQQQRVLPAATNSNASVPTNDTAPEAPRPTSATSMKPPPPQAAVTPSSTASTQAMWNTRILPNTEVSSANAGASSPILAYGVDKKNQKRAANRRSAQLSRKRKKLFIEELKEENDDLRRKEQILRAIPDLIVVFDSSGKLGFVSESAGRFIDMSPDELIGSSFWDRLCEDSVRLLKAAFMDSLAARKADSDTAPLGSGVWELRLVDKSNNFMTVSLNGVVHFKGDVPECVCCIRPQEGQAHKVATYSPSTLAGSVAATTVSSKKLQQATKLGMAKANAAARPVSSSDCSRSSDGSGNERKGQLKELSGDHAVNPHQSMVGNDTSSNDNTAEDDDDEEEGEMDEEDEVDTASRKRRRVVAGQIVNISDGDSIDVSESGSDDGVVSN